MQLLGRDTGELRLPMTALNDREIDSLRKTLKATDYRFSSFNHSTSLCAIWSAGNRGLHGSVSNCRRRGPLRQTNPAEREPQTFQSETIFVAIATGSSVVA